MRAVAYNYYNLSTGISGLDEILRGLLPGDNIVWQVNSIEEYRYYVDFYAHAAEKRAQHLVYFRFSGHEPLVRKEDFPSMQLHELNAEDGFEPFITAIHSVIKQNGRGGYYIFDSLSQLSEIWFSDRMLGNFFMLTCPYLLDMEALAYFGVMRQEHSDNALSPIHNTAQVILDVYTHEGTRYLHPLKVQQRHSRTMHMLHREEGSTYSPVTNSALNSEILSFSPFQAGTDSFGDKDVWIRNFQEAIQLSQSDAPDGTTGPCLDRLLKMVISRDEKMLALAREYFSIDDLIDTARRMIGTGLVGGKTTGMLLARAMVKKSANPVRDRIEVHDSFYVGADVFYTYMVVNGCWWIRQQQKDIDAFLSVAEYARRVILTGSFPPRIVANLSDMLDYFGQSPIIVRSSSLLEDNFGNAFSGKYESVFCPNQGSRERRLENLLTAIKTIYASTLSEKALRYRAQLGILDRDEQMPLLIQRVSGDLHGQYFFPAVGGVGYSRNPYVWHPSIDPKAGVIRIVYGMGTRAVDRSDDDYTRIAALNAVSRRPESGIDAVRKFSQKRVDVIDLEANQLAATDFHDLSADSTPAELSLVATRDMDTKSWFITFDGLLEDTAFAADMSRILATLEEAYAHPVDIEFTVNFTGERDYRINIVQCRPFEARDPASGDLADVTTGDCVDAAPGTAPVKLPGIPEKALISSESGTVIGRSRTIIADVLIYIPADAYDALPPPEKHRVARSIGAIMRQMNPDKKVILAGPGRWGTTSVSLGIPVTFAEISRTACVCEIVEMRDDLVPDVSLGTHFFNDLVEFDILYLALYPHKEGTVLDREYLRTAGNNVRAYLPDGDRMEDVIRVLEGGSEPLVLHADSLNQRYVIGR